LKWRYVVWRSLGGETEEKGECVRYKRSKVRGLNFSIFCGGVKIRVGNERARESLDI